MDNSSTTTDCITLGSNDLVLDLNGHTISGDGGNSDYGIIVNNGVSGITIKNGFIDNFQYGLWDANGWGNSFTVDNITFLSSTVSSILISGSGSTSNNVNIKNSIFYDKVEINTINNLNFSNSNIFYDICGSSFSGISNIIEAIMVLGSDISTTSDCLTLQNNNVILDLNGYTITGDGYSSDYGITINNGISGVEVRNGFIDNFGYGLWDANGWANSFLINNITFLSSTVLDIYISGSGSSNNDITILNTNISSGVEINTIDELIFNNSFLSGSSTFSGLSSLTLTNSFFTNACNSFFNTISSITGEIELVDNSSTITDCITLGSNDLVLDLNGHTISGDGYSTDYGVIINNGVSGITIKNGFIDNFGYGLWDANGWSNSFAVNNLTFLSSTVSDIYVSGGGGTNNNINISNSIFNNKVEINTINNLNFSSSNIFYDICGSSFSSISNIVEAIMVLGSNMSTTSSCLTLQNNNVILDLNGYTISGDGYSSDYGITINNGISGVEVRNGFIDNFGYGLWDANGWANSFLINNITFLSSTVLDIYISGSGSSNNDITILNTNISSGVEINTIDELIFNNSFLSGSSTFSGLSSLTLTNSFFTNACNSFFNTISSITGEIELVDNSSTITDCKSSIDTDSGIDYMNSGTVKDFVSCSGLGCTFNLYNDFCTGDTLTEYYSSGSGYLFSNKNCNDYESRYCVGNTQVWRTDYSCSGSECNRNSDIFVQNCPTSSTQYSSWSCFDTNTKVRTVTSFSPTCSSGSCGQSSTNTLQKADCNSGQYCSGGNCYDYTYSWQTSSWSSCSKSCGGGIKTRSVVCKRNDGVTVSDSYCSSPKPSSSSSCNTQSCCVSNVGNSCLKSSYYRYPGCYQNGEFTGSTMCGSNPTDYGRCDPYGSCTNADGNGHVCYCHNRGTIQCDGSCA